MTRPLLPHRPLRRPSRTASIVVAALALLASTVALAHHGWTGVDETVPYYVSGTVVSSDWKNPHATLVLQVPTALALPPDFDPAKLPAQTAEVDRTAIANALTVPKDAAGSWQLELAPLPRMSAWQLAEAPKVGTRVAAIGYAAPDLKEGKRMRVEFLILDGRALGLRSSPR